jgi:hypothetical protein
MFEVYGIKSLLGNNIHMSIHSAMSLHVQVLDKHFLVFQILSQSRMTLNYIFLVTWVKMS